MSNSKKKSSRRSTSGKKPQSSSKIPQLPNPLSNKFYIKDSLKNPAAQALDQVQNDVDSVTNSRTSLNPLKKLFGVQKVQEAQTLTGERVSNSQGSCNSSQISSKLKNVLSSSFNLRVHHDSLEHNRSNSASGSKIFKNPLMTTPFKDVHERRNSESFSNNRSGLNESFQDGKDSRRKIGPLLLSQKRMNPDQQGTLDRKLALDFEIEIDRDQLKVKNLPANQDTATLNRDSSEVNANDTIDRVQLYDQNQKQSSAFLT